MAERELSVCNEAKTTPPLLLPCAGGSSVRIKPTFHPLPLTPQGSFADQFDELVQLEPSKLNGKLV
jgi:hypothetical protein